MSAKKQESPFRLVGGFRKANRKEGPKRYLVHGASSWSSRGGPLLLNRVPGSKSNAVSRVGDGKLADRFSAADELAMDGSMREDAV